MANWIAPGHVLVGRYPYMQPKEAESREHMRQLLTKARVSTFLSLQDEVPHQEAHHEWPAGGVSRGGRRFLPYARLARQFALGKDLNFLHKPLEDLEVMDLSTHKALVEDLGARVLGGEVVYLHCAGGRGRSATVGACLLAQLYDVSAEEALKRVQLGYNSRDYDLSVSPETRRQRELVHEFCRV